MYISLGMPAVAAANHKHEFNTTMHQPIMEQEHSFLHPLTFLHDRLSALTNFGTAIPAISPTIDPEPKDDEAHDSCSESLDGSQDTIACQPRTAQRTVSSFQLAHPPPATKHKQRRKARSSVLLQLRQISETRNPVPAFEVLPSALFAPRLLRHFPRLLNGRKNLAAHDLVVVNSQEYGSSGKENRAEEDSDCDQYDSREVIGVICPSTKTDQESKDKATIFLDQNSAWTASPMANGGYEFTSIGSQGLTMKARWIPKVPKHKHGASEPSRSSSFERDPNRKFRFTVMNPESRRHPIIGFMDRHSIIVQDQWLVPSTPSATPMPNSPATHQLQPLQQCYFEERLLEPDVLNTTDDHLKTIVLITGIWVAIMEGWSDSCKVHIDPCAGTSTTNSSPSKDPNSSGRHDNGSDGRANTPQSFASAHSRHTSFNILHRPAISINSASPTPSSSIIPQRERSLGAHSTDQTKLRNISFAKPRIQGALTENSVPDHAAVSTEASRNSRRALPDDVPRSRKSRFPQPSAGVTLAGTKDFAEDETTDDDDQARTTRRSYDSHNDGTTTPESTDVSRTSVKSGNKKGRKVGRLLGYFSKKSKKGR
ncbi:hypothetical protein MMC11_001051 [Xylographa trunciseda]|nr:hypothetical protein [Xylographa trunciseda]